jgi:t-SNARE complex subunit (syntaxin)
MNDLAFLISYQSEKIDHIENNVDQTVVYVRNGNQALRDANDYQFKKRKCVCGIICVFLCVIIIVIMIIFLLKNY